MHFSVYANILFTKKIHVITNPDNLYLDVIYERNLTHMLSWLRYGKLVGYSLGPVF